MSKQVHNPNTLFDSLQFGFSQGVSAESGKTIFLSGQVAWDADQQIVGADLESQTNKALDNVAIALASAGGTLADVVRLHIYIDQRMRDDLSGVSRGLRATFPSDPPATTWVLVAGLADPDFLVEIEATAVISAV